MFVEEGGIVRVDGVDEGVVAAEEAFVDFAVDAAFSFVGLFEEDKVFDPVEGAGGTSE